MMQTLYALSGDSSEFTRLTVYREADRCWFEIQAVGGSAELYTWKVWQMWT
jgi:hypothetical protein